MFLNVFALSKAFLERTSCREFLRLLPYRIRRPGRLAKRTDAYGCCTWRVRGTMWSLLSKTGVDERGKSKVVETAEADADTW